jgi:hypothetical protein
MALLSATVDLASETPAIIEFGHFRVLPHRRELSPTARRSSSAGAPSTC